MEIIYGHRSDLPVAVIDESHAKHLDKMVVFGPDRGWPGNALRLMSIGAGGASFNHKHAHPHYVYVTEGEGSVTIEGTVYPASKGSYVLIPGDLQHCLENKGNTPFEFICCIPVNKKGEE